MSSLYRDLAWQDDALCATTDPALFFDDRPGESYRDARKVCAACPVRDACLEWALNDMHPDSGFLAGTTYGDRQEINRQRKAA